MNTLTAEKGVECIHPDIIPFFDFLVNLNYNPYEGFGSTSLLYTSLAEEGKSINNISEYRFNLDRKLGREVPISEAVKRLLKESPDAYSPATYNHIILPALFQKDKFPYEKRFRDKPLLVGEISRTMKRNNIACAIEGTIKFCSESQLEKRTMIHILSEAYCQYADY